MTITATNVTTTAEITLPKNVPKDTTTAVTGFEDDWAGVVHTQQFPLGEWLCG